MGSSVAVVGSVNLDIVVTAPRPPGPGETVMGSDVSMALGGKGANQAIAAAAEARTFLLAAVGADDAGVASRTRLSDAGVDVSELTISPHPTGRAYITVTDDGENSIVVVPLANSDLGVDHAHDALERIRPAIVLCQLEVPLATVTAAAQWCADAGARFLLNPSPPRVLDEPALATADPLLVNKHEAAQLCHADDDADVGELADRLASRSRSVVVTDGPRGACVATGSSRTAVPAPSVPVVDTTGAGDVLAGTVAARLALGDGLVDATRTAVTAASRVIQVERSER